MGNSRYFLVLLVILGYTCSDVESITCISCNSNEDKECARQPQLITNEDECDENGCIIAILADNSTYRGCTSKVPPGATSAPSCVEDRCNIMIYPLTRLQCHQCEGLSCVSVTPGSELPCTLFREDDACFTDVIDESDVIRGCASDNYVGGDYMRLCKTSGCNSQEAVSPFSCILCDSLDNPDCKTGPEPSSECSVPVTDTCDMDVLFGRLEHCFTYRKGERVIRGCSRDSTELVMQTKYVRECILDKCNDECFEPLDCYECNSKDDAYCLDESVRNKTLVSCPVGTTSCYTCRDSEATTHRGCGEFGSEADCEACWYDPGCNDRKMLRCYSCKSYENEQCDLWQNLEDIEIETCNGNCIATLRNGFVERGCQSTSFDCQPSLTCKSCTEDLCNAGPVPDNRLRCYQCGENDPDCNNDQSGELPLSCENVGDEDDMCYTFVTNGDRLVRGCTTDSRYAECAMSPPGKCITCSGDGCNSEGYIRQLTCVKCDSNTDANCKTAVVTGENECAVESAQFCQVDVQFGNYEYCFTYRYGERVRRGCSKQDPEFAEQLKYVRECRLSNCNNECIDPARCYTCDSNSNSNCVDNVFLIDQTTCNTGDISCFSCRDSSKRIRRGCGSGDTFGSCVSCWDDPGCNDKPMLSCYVCNSRVDKKCADWTSPETINTSICNGNCIATLRDGFIERGCQSNSFDCPPSETCVRCGADDCNGGLIPVDRLVCHQCNESDSDCNAAKDNAAPTACDLYQKDDQCYYYLDNNNKMIRGCASDERYAECITNPDRCVSCSTSGCNSNAAVTQPTLACAKCNGEESCKWAQSEILKCESPVPYYASETCYVYRSSAGNVKRGCSLDGDACYPSEPGCTVCSTSGCNNVNRIVQSCLQCEGKDQQLCVSGKNVSSTECSEMVQTYETRGCYAKRDGDTVIRGCIWDLDDEGKKACEDDKDNCQICIDQGCNTKDLTNAAVKLHAFSALLFTICAYIAKM